MTTTITRRTELAHRASDAVSDARADDSFELELDGRDALDAFDRPYAYAARTAPIISLWRTDHARTDR